MQVESHNIYSLEPGALHQMVCLKGLYPWAVSAGGNCIDLTGIKLVVSFWGRTKAPT